MIKYHGSSFGIEDFFNVDQQHETDNVDNEDTCEVSSHHSSYKLSSRDSNVLFVWCKKEISCCDRLL